MVKAYLRYEQARAFGVIASPEACPVYADDNGKLGTYFISQIQRLFAHTRLTFLLFSQW
jgi:hypothetical protein